MAVKDGTADGSYKQEYTVTAIIITDFRLKFQHALQQQSTIKNQVFVLFPPVFQMMSSNILPNSHGCQYIRKSKHNFYLLKVTKTHTAQPYLTDLGKGILAAFIKRVKKEKYSMSSFG
jgi:hypothetical protein